MTEAIVWAVIWLILTFAGTWLIVAAAAFIGFLIGEASDKPGIGFIFVIIGWLAGITWFIFAAVQTVLQIIAVVQVASGA